MEKRRRRPSPKQLVCLRIKGEQKPGFDNLWALADHFGVTVDYLMGRTDEKRT